MLHVILGKFEKSSVEKFAKSIGKDVEKEGFFDACVLKLGKTIDDDQTVKGMCANMKDVFYGSTYWRGEKTAKEKEADIPAENLSSADARRLEVARALAAKPEKQSAGCCNSSWPAGPRIAEKK